MRCDECGSESSGGEHKEWIAAISQDQYESSTNNSVVARTYDYYEPIESFLCEPCYEPRGRTRRWTTILILVAGAGVGISLLVLTYYLWDRGWSVLTVIVAFLVLKFTYGELGMRFRLYRWSFRSRSDAEIHDVLEPYAKTKAKRIGRDTVFDLKTFEHKQNWEKIKKSHGL